MKDYVIVTDATADLTPELALENSIEVIPMEFNIGEEDYFHYPDAREYPMSRFYERLKNGETAKTSQINRLVYCSTFEEALKQGKDVLYLAFSSALSGSCSSAMAVARELNEKYAPRRVVVVDTLCACGGEGLLVYTAAKKRAQGMELDELVAWAEENAACLQHWFTVDDLNHLKRGGRISKAVALAGTMLGIKPILVITGKGTIEAVAKVKRRKRALEALVERVGEFGSLLEEQTVFVGHCNCEEDAVKVARNIRERYGVPETVVHFVGPVVGTHAGPGGLGVFFFGQPR